MAFFVSSWTWLPSFDLWSLTLGAVLGVIGTVFLLINYKDTEYEDDNAWNGRKQWSVGWDDQRQRWRKHGWESELLQWQQRFGEGGDDTEVDNFGQTIRW